MQTKTQLLVFFFQAEDGIRDGHVTGVQTCALPIFPGHGPARRHAHQRPGPQLRGVPRGLARPGHPPRTRTHRRHRGGHPMNQPSAASTSAQGAAPRPWKVAVTGDYADADGSTIYGDIGLDQFAEHGLEWSIVSEAGSPLRGEELEGYDALVLLGSDRKSTRLNSSHVAISYAVFCLQKK